jgi:predicted RNA-binding Zn-ribbon protein involved in translation (DUF1610 family)
MEYECTNEECGWVGENPDESEDGEGTAVCPDCGFSADSED